MIQYLYLGRTSYPTGLALQQELIEARHQGLVQNVLLLLEHPPVLTLGRNAHRSNILASDQLLATHGITVHEINRGGDVTYHGPGQLVGYPIFDLRSLSNGKGGRLGPVDYVRRMEEALMRLCAGYGIVTGRVQGRTGVWTNPPAPNANPAGTPTTLPEKKIGAIGVHVSRGITSHGFALNVSTRLQDFQWIVPCGIADREVTSIEHEVRPPYALPTLEEAANAAARCVGQTFNEHVLALPDLAALRANYAAPVPAQDVPLTIPADLRRLHPGPAPSRETERA